MTDAQTTPTRDEAVRAGIREAVDDAMSSAHRCGGYEAKDLDEAVDAILKVIAPASGRVDAGAAEREACARIADAEANRQPNSQFRTNFELGASDAARRIAVAIRAQALSPAATPVSEAGGERDLVADLAAVVRVQNGNRHGDINALLARADAALAKPVSEAGERLAKGCCSASSPCFHQKHDPTTICEACRNAGLRADTALAKAASSPAGGDVVRAALEAIIADWDERSVGEQERFVQMHEDRPGYWSPNARMVSSEKIAAGRIALSQSTSAGSGTDDAS